MKKLVPAIILASALAFGHVQEVKAQKIKPFFEFYLGYNLNTLNTKIDSIPANLRYVPIHKDDTYASEANNGPIKDGVELAPFTLIRMKGGEKISFLEDKLNFKVGVGLDFRGNMNSKNFHERNYTNAPGTSQRGYGAALTFYNLNYTFLTKFNTRAFANVFSEAEIVSERFRIKAGYELSYESISMKTGWDRWNASETYKRYSLANVMQGKPYISIGLNEKHFENWMGSPEITIGYTQFLGKDTKAIPINIQFKDNIFIGVNMVAYIDRD